MSISRPKKRVGKTPGSKVRNRKEAPKPEGQEDAVYRARSKFERWVECYSGIYQYQFMPLVNSSGGDDEDDNAVFSAEEFALVPMRDLCNYELSIEEAREMLDHMQEQLDAAVEARQAAGE